MQLRACQEWCMENEDCSHFTLEYENSVCVLFSECREFRTSMDISGILLV